MSDILDDQLRAGAEALHVQGVIKAEVQRLDAAPAIRIGSRPTHVSDAQELLYQPGASTTSRIWALRFFVCERASAKSKLGLVVELQLREADGRPVSGCSAWLKQTGGRGQTFEINNAIPTVLEVKPDCVAEGEEAIRDFVRHAVSALPTLEGIGASQFVLAKLARRPPLR